MTKKTKCDCMKEIEAILNDWKDTVNTDQDLKRAMVLGSAMGTQELTNNELVRINKKHLLQPIMRWIMKHGGSIE